MCFLHVHFLQEYFIAKMYLQDTSIDITTLFTRTLVIVQIISFPEDSFEVIVYNNCLKSSYIRLFMLIYLLIALHAFLILLLCFRLFVDYDKARDVLFNYNVQYRKVFHIHTDLYNISYQD